MTVDILEIQIEYSLNTSIENYKQLFNQALHTAIVLPSQSILRCVNNWKEGGKTN